jgi:hypothetical protein
MAEAGLRAARTGAIRWQAAATKSALREPIAVIAKAGFNVVHLDYALSPAYRYPVPMEQRNQAIAFLHAQADRLGLDMTRVFIMGRSAGAQIPAGRLGCARRIDPHGAACRSCGRRRANRSLMSPASRWCHLDERDQPRDWWLGAPMGSKPVDAVYTGREGPIHMTWPDPGIGLMMTCSPNSPLASVFTPTGRDWFCVEPVSRNTNALNMDQTDGAMAVLQSGEGFAIKLFLRAELTCQTNCPPLVTRIIRLAGGYALVVAANGTASRRVLGAPALL